MKTQFRRLLERLRLGNSNSQQHAEVLASHDTAYIAKMSQELANFREDLNVHELPQIFHYWSGRYLAPKLNSMGLEHPDDFFAKSLSRSFELEPNGKKRFISIGAGNCDTEVRVAKRLINAGFNNFVIECLEINRDMLMRGQTDAAAQGVRSQIAFVEQDFNTWKPRDAYDSIIANHSLHHVVELEHLFDSVLSALRPGARFIIADMIGRNGHQLWPEALTLLEPFWAELPESYRYNHQLKRNEPTYLDWDCSSYGFEGIRAQDILPQLIERFEFELFLPFANIIQPFVGRGFGHNFNADLAWDREFIDRVHAVDEKAIFSGGLKPTQMFAVLTTRQVEQPQYLSGLDPKFCVRVV
jgi:SAM-dependent methyltransferase